MGELLESGMLICFGVSWPVSIFKSLRTRSSKGKSIIFLFLVWLGYICGIGSKFYRGDLTYVLALYILNLVMVTIDGLLYFRNQKLDRKREKMEKAIRKGKI